MAEVEILPMLMRAGGVGWWGRDCVSDLPADLQGRVFYVDGCDNLDALELVHGASTETVQEGGHMWHHP